MRPEVDRRGGLLVLRARHPFPTRARPEDDTEDALVPLPGGTVEYVLLDWDKFGLAMREYEGNDDQIEDIVDAVEDDDRVATKPRVIVTGTFFSRKCPDAGRRPGGDRYLSDGDVINDGARLSTSPQVPASLDNERSNRGNNFSAWVESKFWLGYIVIPTLEGTPPRVNNSKWKIRGPGRPEPADHEAAVGGLPRLIQDRQIVQMPTGKEGADIEVEMGVGLHHPTRLVVVAALAGVSMAEVKQFFKALDVDDAVLLDGGSTPAMWVNEGAKMDAGRIRFAEKRHGTAGINKLNVPNSLCSFYGGYRHTPTNYLMFVPR